MTEEQTNAIQAHVSCMRKQWVDRKNAAYADLLTLAELGDDELTCEEQKNVKLAFSTILRYGSHQDRTEAIGLYIAYLNLKTLLES